MAAQAQARLTPSPAALSDAIRAQYMFRAPRGPFVIVSVHPEGPAGVSGKVAAGDMLHAVDYTSLHDKTEAQVRSMILGRPGSEISLIISTAQDLLAPNSNTSLSV